MPAKKTPSKVMTSLRLPQRLLARLQAVSSLTGVAQGMIVTQALEVWLEQEIAKRRIGKAVEATVETIIKERGKE